MVDIQGFIDSSPSYMKYDYKITVIVQKGYKPENCDFRDNPYCKVIEVKFNSQMKSYFNRELFDKYLMDNGFIGQLRFFTKHNRVLADKVFISVCMNKIHIDNIHEYFENDRFKTAKEAIEHGYDYQSRFLDASYSLEMLIEWLEKNRIGDNLYHMDELEKTVRDWNELNNQVDNVANTGAASQTDKTPNERELKQGLREIWIKEGNPEMKAYFPALKKYVNQAGSPIVEHYTAGKDAGIRYKTSSGTTGYLKKKTISNYVSDFKKTS